MVNNFSSNFITNLTAHQLYGYIYSSSSGYFTSTNVMPGIIYNIPIKQINYLTISQLNNYPAYVFMGNNLSGASDTQRNYIINDMNNIYNQLTNDAKNNIKIGNNLFIIDFSGLSGIYLNFDNFNINLGALSYNQTNTSVKSLPSLYNFNSTSLIINKMIINYISDNLTKYIIDTLTSLPNSNNIIAKKIIAKIIKRIEHKII